MAFRRIYYDAYNNRLYFWPIDGQKEIIIPKFEYYVKDTKNQSPIKDIYGIPVIKKVSETREGMKSIVEGGVYCCETDLDMSMKFLHQRFENEELKTDMSKLHIGILDIEVSSPREFPKPDEAKYPVNLISIYSSKYKEVFTFGLKEYKKSENSIVKNYHYCENEKLLLENFVEAFRKLGLDILTGWNCDEFDLPYLINRMEQFNIERSLSPINIVTKKQKTEGYIIAGISILDYMQLYKKYTYESKERYSLNFISKAELGEGKLEFEGVLSNLAEEDWNKFVEYNVQDVMLVKKLDDKLRFIQLMVDLAYQALIPFEKVFSPVILHTGLIMKYVHKKGMVVPDKKFTNKKSIPGAYVFSEPGFHKYIINFDVESMYPHMLIVYNISPETIVVSPSDTTGLIKTPLSDEHKIWYDGSKKGILPEITEIIFNERKMFKLKKKLCKSKVKDPKYEKIYQEIEKENGTAGYYDSQQQIRKIMINSLYGVLANEFFHFYNYNNAMAITLGGQDLIKYLSNSVNDYFKNFFYKNKKYFSEINEKNKCSKDVIVLIDTDSIYLTLEEIISKLQLKFNSDDEFCKWATDFNNEMLNPFFIKLLTLYTSKYKIPNIINFQREKISKNMLITAKKRYILEVLDSEGERYQEPKYITKGVEIVRTDTPQFCRDKLFDTVKEIFRTQNMDSVIDYMKKVKKQFIKENIDNIGIPTGISDYDSFAKPIEKYLKEGLSYPKGCPIHARASINYNYLISKYNLKYQAVFNGTKMRYIYVKENNELHQNIIGYINWPKEFDKIFKIDYDIQWEKTFQSVIQRFFEVLNWGEINLEDRLRKLFG